MVSTTVLYILFISWCLEVSGNGIEIDPIKTSWRFANAICDSSNYILMPGRSYRKADLIKSLQMGQAIWMKGWRMVSEHEPKADGNIRFLKTDYIPNYNVMIRKFICEYRNGSFDVPVTKPSDQSNAEEACQSRGGELAKIGRHDVKTVLDTIGYKTPHWSRAVTADDSIAKQCLAVRRISSGIKYFYEDCDVSLPFACLQDEKTSMVFAPVVSKRDTTFKDFEDEIIKVLSRTTITPPTTTDGVDESGTTTGGIDKSETAEELSTESTVQTTQTVSVSSNYSNPEFQVTEVLRASSAKQFSNTSVSFQASSEGVTMNTPVGPNILQTTFSTIVPTSSVLSHKNMSASDSVVSRSSIKLYTTNLTEPNNMTSSLVYTPGMTLATRPMFAYDGNTSWATTTERLMVTSSLLPSFTVETVSTASDYQTKTFEFAKKPLPSLGVYHLINSSLTYTDFVTDSNVGSSDSVFLEDSKSRTELKAGSTNYVSTYTSKMTASSNYSLKIQPSPSVSLSSIQYTTEIIQGSESDISTPAKLTYYSEYSESSTTETSFKIYSTETVKESVSISSTAAHISRIQPLFTIAIQGSENDISTPAKPTYYSEYSESSTTETSFKIYSTETVKESVSISSTAAHINRIQPSFTIAAYSIPGSESLATAGESIIFDIASDDTYYLTEESSYALSEFSSDQVPYTTVVSPHSAINGVRYNSTKSTLLYSEITVNATKLLGDIENTSIKDSSLISVSPKSKITPAVTVDIIMSEDLGKFDVESINRSSRSPQKEEWSLPMWIAVGVIGVACIVSLIIAIVLYNRRQKQKKLTVARNGAQHPLMPRSPTNEAYAAPMTKQQSNGKKQSDQAEDVFVDEAYDL